MWTLHVFTVTGMEVIMGWNLDSRAGDLRCMGED